MEDNARGGEMLCVHIYDICRYQACMRSGRAGFGRPVLVHGCVLYMFEDVWSIRG